MRQKNKSIMQGFSIIELMIAALIGVFLLAGLTSVYISARYLDKMRSQVSEMEENARVALMTMRQIISHAGYPSEYSLPIDQPFYAERSDIPNPECRSGGVDSNLINYKPILNKKTQDSAVAKRDTMVVVNLLDSPLNALPGISSKLIEDCNGSVVEPECSSDPVHGLYAGASAKVYNYLYINTPSGRRALSCMGSLGDSQPIAENIENLQFLYGVLKASGNMVYKNAEDVTSKNEWGGVVAVQVGILVRSEKEVLEKDEKRVFLVLDETITTAKDKRLYRAYSTTILLPNMSLTL